MDVIIKQDGSPDRQLTAHQGQTVLSFLANQGIHLDAPCAGRGICGKCRVKLSGAVSQPDEAERELVKDMEEPGSAAQTRLACRAQLLGEAVVELPAKVRFSSVKGLGESEPYDIDSPLKKKNLAVGDRQDATDLMTVHNIQKGSIAALNQLAEVDAAKQPVLAVMWGDELLEAKALTDENKDESLLAAAVDLGTTGLGVAIIDVVKGEVVAQGTSLNPQTACGGDVITRITMASEGPEKQKHLQNLALQGIGDLVKETAGPERLPYIKAAVVSGNTTMLYLLSGVQPKGLAQAPYRPTFIKSLDISHLAEAMNLPACAKVFTTTNISAYVGGDISSGMLAVGLKKRPGTVLYIDIGTNGEIVLSHKSKLVATSCAAGPALEGMNILCGQRAVAGAVDSFVINEDLSYSYTTIGGAPATGICGSGLVDLSAELVKAGLIHRTGRFQKPKNCPEPPAWVEQLVQDGRFNFDPNVYFDQKDVRQVQLAKGAIAAAVEMLLAHMGLTKDDLDEIIIAGAFGFHLKAESLKAISLIPSDYQGPVRFVGNSSLAGAARVLLTPAAIEALDSLSAETVVIELGFDPKFQDTFVRHLGF